MPKPDLCGKNAQIWSAEVQKNADHFFAEKCKTINSFPPTHICDLAPRLWYFRLIFPGTMPKPSDIAAKTFKKDIFATEHKIRIFWETHGYRHPKSRPASLFSPQKGVKRGPRRRQKDLWDIEKCLLFEMVVVAKLAVAVLAVVSKSGCKQISVQLRFSRYFKGNRNFDDIFGIFWDIFLALFWAVLIVVVSKLTVFTVISRSRLQTNFSSIFNSASNAQWLFKLPREEPNFAKKWKRFTVKNTCTPFL